MNKWIILLKRKGIETLAEKHIRVGDFFVLKQLETAFNRIFYVWTHHKQKQFSNISFSLLKQIVFRLSNM